MKTLLIGLLSLVVGFCVGVGVTRPSLKQLRVELATKDGELAKREAEEDLALKELKLCMATLHTQNDLLRQNNQTMADLIRRKRKE
jgi:Tfp pilus assembly protein PilX